MGKGTFVTAHSIKGTAPASANSLLVSVFLSGRAVSTLFKIWLNIPYTPDFALRCLSII